MDDPLDRIRDALAGRYEITREVGAGGMARVYLARDVKHDRDVAIKVLDPDVSAQLGSERFLREISIAAGFTHPHIVPVYDSGEADGLLYFVMPFLESESLKARLARDRPLPIDEAVRIGREVAEALAYAHSRGVVHRDIKPANILLSSGQAVVADFGIARALEASDDLRLTQTDMVAGTPLYMSPEQLEGSHDVDARSDLYALGCVVYEMLTGDPPHSGSTIHAIVASHLTSAVRPIHQVRDTVPTGVEHAVMRALAKIPADRFATAEEFGAALTPSSTTGGYHYVPARTLRSRKAWVLRIGAVAVPALIALTLFMTGGAQGLDFGERDWIVIADLDNQTQEEVFDRSLNAALTTAVSQSQYVNVYPRSRVSETLRRMGRDSATVFDEALAREVAVRENLKAALALEISRLGDTYILTTRVLTPETGVAVYSETVRAQGQSGVLGAVDELARRLRSNLGESLLNIRQRSVPLPEATTHSLEALKNYSDGSVAWSASRYEEARALWSQAVVLDSTFAWAHASLGLAANWLEGFGSGRPHFERALAHLDRVSERERLWIRSLIESGEPMVETLRIFTQLYPDDRDAWYNLGNGLRNLRRHEEALEAYTRSLALDSMQSFANVNRAMTLDALGRYEEANTSFEAAFRVEPSARREVRGDLNRISGFVRAKVGDTLGARETFELALAGGPEDRANALRSLALLDIYRGQVRSAIDRLREAVNLTEGTNSRLSEFRNRLYLAAAYDLAGSEPAARIERERADAIAREIRADLYWLEILGKQWARSGAVERAASVVELMENWPDLESNDRFRGLADQVRGELALARGDLDAARDLLQRGRAAVREADALESLAYGHAESGRRQEAAAAYEELLASKQLGDELQGYWLASHVALGRVYEALGDTAKAGAWYRALIELWSDGDAELPLLQEARSRLGAIER